MGDQMATRVWVRVREEQHDTQDCRHEADGAASSGGGGGGISWAYGACAGAEGHTLGRRVGDWMNRRNMADKAVTRLLAHNAPD